MLDGFDESADYVIWDDIDFNSIYSPKSWFGAQKEIIVTDKYRHKIRLHWGKPSIYLCNEIPLEILNNDWYEYNCTIINLLTKLY